MKLLAESALVNGHYGHLPKVVVAKSARTKIGIIIGSGYLIYTGIEPPPTRFTEEYREFLAQQEAAGESDRETPVEDRS